MTGIWGGPSSSCRVLAVFPHGVERPLIRPLTSSQQPHLQQMEYIRATVHFIIVGKLCAVNSSISKIYYKCTYTYVHTPIHTGTSICIFMFRHTHFWSTGCLKHRVDSDQCWRELPGVRKADSLGNGTAVPGFGVGVSTSGGGRNGDTHFLGGLSFACPTGPQEEKGGAFLLTTRPLPARGCHCSLFPGNWNGHRLWEPHKRCIRSWDELRNHKASRNGRVQLQGLQALGSREQTVARTAESH